MKCPICKKRVADQDDLQIHYLEDCKAVGNQRVDNQDEDSLEDGEGMVEIDFKWSNTKGANEEKIYLISSLAGQILLDKKPKEDIYQSNKVFVPCGQHCCQLVIGDYCYPVIDIDVGSMQDSCYIILEEDVEGSTNEDVNAADNPNHTFEDDTLIETYLPSVPQVTLPKFDEKQVVKTSGPIQESAEQKSVSDEKDEVTQQNHDLTGMATNGVHSVQVHNTHDNAQEIFNQFGGCDLNPGNYLQQPRGQEALDTGYQSNHASENADSQNRLNVLPGSDYQPNHNRINGRKQRGTTRMSSDSLADQLAFQNSLAVNRRGDKKKLFENEEKGESFKKDDSSWGYDEDVRNHSVYGNTASDVNDDKVKMPQYKSQKSELSGHYFKDEKITELYAKCVSYETELERMKMENKDLYDQLIHLRERTDYDEKNRMIDLRQRLKELRDENKTLRDENESLKTAHSLQREDMNRINKQLTNEIDDLSDKIENMKFGNRSFQNEDKLKIKELQDKVVDLTLDKERLEKRLSRIYAELTTSQTEQYDQYGYIRRRSFDLDGSDVSDKLLQSTNKDPYLDYEKKPRPSKRSPYNENFYSTMHDSSKREASRFHNDDVYSPYHGSRFSTEMDRVDNVSKTPKYDSTLDENSNLLRQSHLSSSHYRSMSSRQRDDSRMTSAIGPIKASHSIYNDTSQNVATSQYAKEHVDLDSILAPATLRTDRKERKTRRERPHSFHGASTSSSFFESSSPNVNNTTSYKRYTSQVSNAMDLFPKDSSVEHLKPFMPQSPSDISIGMRVLVTRSSGRIGKGLLKWKGHLPGHSEMFLGIELETANGKNDGIFEGRRYFSCKKDHGIFAKFSKLVMAWGSKI